MMRYRAGPSHCSLIYRKKKKKNIFAPHHNSHCVSPHRSSSASRGQERSGGDTKFCGGKVRKHTHVRTHTQTQTQHTQALKSRPTKPKLKDSPVIFFDCKSNQTTFNKNAEKQTKRFLKNITESWGLRGRPGGCFPLNLFTI